LNDTPPDVVLLMIGTNDCMVNYQFATVRQRMEHLIDRTHRRQPNAYLVVSTLLPIADPAANARVRQFNRFLPDVVAARAKLGHHILLVDIAGFLDPHHDFADGVHPNPAGYAKMAEVWLVALVYVVLFG
jgi:lysophospholipase L1-like esterase